MNTMDRAYRIIYEYYYVGLIRHWGSDIGVFWESISKERDFDNSGRQFWALHWEA